MQSDSTCDAAASAKPIEAGPRSRRAADLLALLIIALSVALVFGRTLSFEFVLYDDNFHITENRNLMPPTWAGLARLWRAPYFGEYVPLTYTFFAAENWISSWYSTAPHPAVFHGGSLLLHVACALSVYSLLRRFVAGSWAASLGTLLFALHPLQVESVAWVSETRGLLAALFGVWAVRWYLDAAPSSHLDRQGKLHGRSYGLATLCLLAALLSKPSAVSIPLMAAVIDRHWLGRSWRKIAVAMWPWLAMSAVVIVITKLQQSDAVVRDVAPIWARPFIAGDALAFYLAKLAWPVTLFADYGRSPSSVVASGAIFWTWLIPCGVGGAILWRYKREEQTALGLFLAGLSPMLGFVPFSFQESSTVADRYVYLALLGPAWWLAHGWTTMLRSDGWGKTVFACIGMLFVWAGASYLRADTWRDSQTLLMNFCTFDTPSFLRHNNMSVLWRDLGRPWDAGIDAQIAVELRPHSAEAHINLGAAQWDLGQRDQAIASFRQATVLAPYNRTAWRNLANTLAAADRIEEAIQAHRSLLSRWPDDSSARSNLDRLEHPCFPSPAKPTTPPAPTQNPAP